MNKFICITLLVLAFIVNAQSGNAQSVDELRQKVRELDGRVTQLETIIIPALETSIGENQVDVINLQNRQPKLACRYTPGERNNLNQIETTCKPGEISIASDIAVGGHQIRPRLAVGSDVVGQEFSCTGVGGGQCMTFCCKVRW